jgi:hypothetical protein
MPQRNSQPLVCPRGAHEPGPDCPLWDARERIDFMRSIEADGATRIGMGALVWADFNRVFQRPASPPTRPFPAVGQPPAALPDPSPEPVTVAEKGVSQHV